MTGVPLPCLLPATAAGFAHWLEGDGLFVEVTLPTPYVTPVTTTSNGVFADREEFDFAATDEVRAFGGTVPHTFGIDAPDLELTPGQQYVLAVFSVPTLLARNGGVEYAHSGGTPAVLKVDAGMVSQTCLGQSGVSPESVSLSTLEPLLVQAAASVPPPPPAPFTATPTAS